MFNIVSRIFIISKSNGCALSADGLKFTVSRIIVPVEYFYSYKLKKNSKRVKI